MPAADLLAKPTAKVDDMTDRENGYGKSASVVEGLRHGVLPVLAVCAMVLVVAFGGAYAPMALADDGSGTGSSGDSSVTDQGTSTFTDDITDTNNLLGADLSAVTDAIKKTKQDTGVTVKLMYIPSFGTTDKPAKWASDVLEALKPEHNTVMMAVASEDGNLVVAVSSNSDEWLKKQQTVDDLSKVATDPLLKDTPDWAGAATAMMDEIAKVKQTSTSSSTVTVGIVVMVAVLAVLVVIIVVTAIIRSHRKKKARKGKARRRHKAPSAKGRASAPADTSSDSAAAPAAAPIADESAADAAPDAQVPWSVTPAGETPEHPETAVPAPEPDQPDGSGVIVP